MVIRFINLYLQVLLLFVRRMTMILFKSLSLIMYLNVLVSVYLQVLLSFVRRMTMILFKSLSLIMYLNVLVSVYLQVLLLFVCRMTMIWCTSSSLYCTSVVAFRLQDDNDLVHEFVSVLYKCCCFSFAGWQGFGARVCQQRWTGLPYQSGLGGRPELSELHTQR